MTCVVAPADDFLLSCSIAGVRKCDKVLSLPLANGTELTSALLVELVGCDPLRSSSALPTPTWVTSARRLELCCCSFTAIALYVNSAGSSGCG